MTKRAAAGRSLRHPATVIAPLALLASLVGTGYASGLINGRQIKNGTITGSKLANNTIPGSKLQNDTIPLQKLSPPVVLGLHYILHELSGPAQAVPPGPGTVSVCMPASRGCPRRRLRNLRTGRSLTSVCPGRIPGRRSQQLGRPGGQREPINGVRYGQRAVRAIASAISPRTGHPLQTVHLPALGSLVRSQPRSGPHQLDRSRMGDLALAAPIQVPTCEKMALPTGPGMERVATRTQVSPSSPRSRAA